MIKLRPAILPSLLLAALLPLPAAARAEAEVTPARSHALTPETVIRPVGREEAARLLREPDDFTRRLSPFDRSARLRTPAEVSPGEYLEFVAGEARDWTDDELGVLAAAVDLARRNLEGWRLALPREIRLITTTGREEGNAAYTRGDAVVVPADKFRVGPEKLRELLLHEVFHIFSRHHPAARDRLYAIVGFQPCGEVALPAGLAGRKLTNPDAPIIAHRIELQRDGRDFSAVPVLFSREPRYPEGDTRPFFAFLEFRLMEIEPAGAGWSARETGGQPALHAPGEVRGFQEKVGRNTGYIIHPEEVLADNFVLALLGRDGLPDPAIPQRLREFFTAPPAAP